VTSSPVIVLFNRASNFPLIKSASTFQEKRDAQDAFLCALLSPGRAEAGNLLKMFSGEKLSNGFAMGGP
ncbi:mCG11123, isoform CRA_b, partial [Mus musculus]